MIAFQSNEEKNSILIEIPKITSLPGVIPTAIWYEDETKKTIIGSEALRMKNYSNTEHFFHSNIKRLIGNTVENQKKKTITPMESV